MAARGVVPTFDVAEDRHPGLCLRGEPPACQQFAFERGKEALAHGVVIRAVVQSRSADRYAGLSNLESPPWTSRCAWKSCSRVDTSIARSSYCACGGIFGSSSACVTWL